MKNTIFCSGIPVNEISIRYNRPQNLKFPIVKDVDDAIKIFRPCFETDRINYKEFFFAMFLSGASEVLAISLIGIGTEKAVLVSNQEIVSAALLLGAQGVIVAHNHPANTLKFSEYDKKVSKKLMLALNLYNINFIDHLVFTKDDEISLFTEHEELFN